MEIKIISSESELLLQVYLVNHIFLIAKDYILYIINL